MNARKGLCALLCLCVALLLLPGMAGAGTVRSQLTVTGTIASDKEYDGTTDATVTLGTVSGIARGDDVTVTASGAFVNREIGMRKTVHLTYTLSGADAGNYLAPVAETTTASIHPSALNNQIVGINNGEYFMLGSEVSFTAVGGGMNSNPQDGATRYLPTAWATDVSRSFNFQGGYTQRMSTAGMSQGAHTLTVTFVRQGYEGGRWIDLVDVEPDRKSVSFFVFDLIVPVTVPSSRTASPSSQTPPPPTPTAAPSPQTGDTALPLFWLGLGAVAASALFLLLLIRRKTI